MLQNQGMHTGTYRNASDKGKGQSDFLSQTGGAASNPQTPLPACWALPRLSVSVEVLWGERRGGRC